MTGNVGAAARAVDVWSPTARGGRGHGAGGAAIMGPSGSGRSTLMHCLAGLDAIDSGDVRVGGTKVNGLRDKGLRDKGLRDKGLTDLRRRQCGTQPTFKEGRKSQPQSNSGNVADRQATRGNRPRHRCGPGSARRSGCGRIRRGPSGRGGPAMPRCPETGVRPRAAAFPAEQDRGGLFGRAGRHDGPASHPHGTRGDPESKGFSSMTSSPALPWRTCLMSAVRRRGVLGYWAKIAD